jgi:hypothetical protein
MPVQKKQHNLKSIKKYIKTALSFFNDSNKRLSCFALNPANKEAPLFSDLVSATALVCSSGAASDSIETRLQAMAQDNKTINSIKTQINECRSVNNKAKVVCLVLVVLKRLINCEIGLNGKANIEEVRTLSFPSGRSCVSCFFHLIIIHVFLSNQSLLCNSFAAI